jgi:hypothetical protein
LPHCPSPLSSRRSASSAAAKAPSHRHRSGRAEPRPLLLLPRRCPRAAEPRVHFNGATGAVILTAEDATPSTSTFDNRLAPSLPPRALNQHPITCQPRCRAPQPLLRPATDDSSSADRRYCGKPDFGDPRPPRTTQIEYPESSLRSSCCLPLTSPLASCQIGQRTASYVPAGRASLPSLVSP